MKRLVWLTVCVAGLAGLVGRASPQQPARERPRAATAGSAIIRGTVFASDTGAPLRRARVNWLAQSSPALVDGKLIFAANKTLYAFDAKTGQDLTCVTSTPSRRCR